MTLAPRTSSYRFIYEVFSVSTKTLSEPKHQPYINIAELEEDIQDGLKGRFGFKFINSLGTL